MDNQKTTASGQPAGKRPAESSRHQVTPGQTELASLDPHSMASNPFDTAIPHAPSLSLPSGGGAIHGMGEKFNVSLSDGSGSTTIPIRVSPARGAILPELSINYNSGAGNGVFGLGWNLSLPQITRKTEKGLPTYQDSGSEGESDVFVLSNSEDLVPFFKHDSSGKLVRGQDDDPIIDEKVQDGYTVRRYAPRIQQSFDRVEKWTSLSDPNDVHWRRTTGQNLTTVFGSSTESRIYDPNAKSGDMVRIFSWLITEIFDPLGNAVLFRYKAEDSTNILLSRASEANRDETTRSANRYLIGIHYGNVIPNRQMDTWKPTSALLLPQESWNFSVVFDYGEYDMVDPKPGNAGLWGSRMDPFSDCRPGFEVRTYRLCHRILMFHHFAELGTTDYLVGSTDFVYAHNNVATYLTEVTKSGYTRNSHGTSYTKKSLPPLRFEYSQFPTDDELSSLVVQDVDKNFLSNIPTGLDGQNYQLIDLNSEGLSGILTEQGGAWFFARNSSASNVTEETGATKARFEPLNALQTRPIDSVKDKNTHFGDVSGSGKTDLISMNWGVWGFYERTEEGDWTNLQVFQKFPNLDITQKDVKFIDLTGDGLADILIYADQIYTWYPSLGAGGYGDGQTCTQPNQEDSGPIPVYGDSEQSIYLADMSGDGLSDLLRIRNGDVSYWPCHGYGKFGRLVRMDNAPCFDNNDIFSNKRIRLADIDGSGSTDIIYLGSDGVDLYLNQSGNGFSDRKRLQSFAPIDSLSQVSALDLLGNGTSCLVWSSTLPYASPAPLRYVDFMQGKKPHLLTKLVNNLGTETTIHYSPSTKFYLQDQEAGNPWLTRIPFPVQVVDMQETVDKIGGNRLVSRYKYSHGFYDGLEREFRGFARVDQWDTDHFSAMSTSESTNIDASWHVPPVHTKTWFHTGAYIDYGDLSSKLAKEYFNPASMNTLIGEVVLPEGLSGDQQREASRALKGQILRKEVYAEDDSDKAGVPYSVQQSNYAIVPIQPEQDTHFHSVYFVHPRESVLYQSERQVSDPRVSHEVVLEIDQFGDVLKGLRISYGRQPGNSKLTGIDKERQETDMIIYTEAGYTNNVDDPDNYLLPHPCEARQYQVSGLPHPASGRFQFSDLVANSSSLITDLVEVPYEVGASGQSPQKRLFKNVRMLYKKDDLSGYLRFGQIEPLSLTGIAYDMIFTPGLLDTTFTQPTPNSGSKSLLPNPIDVLGGTGGSEGGYVDLDKNGCWWKQSTVARFTSDLTATPDQERASARTNFYSPKAFVDQFQKSTLVEYDDHILFPVRITNPVGNVESTLMDYRTLQPRSLTSPNGNTSITAFDALGLVAGIAWMGKTTDVGDNLDDFVADLSQDQINEFFATPTVRSAAAVLGNATSRVVYDYGRYFRDPISSLPVFTAAITRETHASDPAPVDGLKVQIKFTYSDGFGRPIQMKDYTKPGPLTENGDPIDSRWVGSGWTIYNNKGQPVRQYENFFDDTHKFKFDMKAGVSPVIMYDPVGRPVATLRADHGLEKLVVTDAWSTTSYDSNDNIFVSDPKQDVDIGHYFDSLPTHEYMPSWYNARINGQMGLVEKDAATKSAVHKNTPAITHLDPTGRVILNIQDNGSETFSTHINRDIQGNELSISDPMGRVSMKIDYSMAGDVLHQSSMDAGEDWTLKDVRGEVLMKWNGRGFRSRTVLDPLRRPIESWLSENDGQEVMTDRITYGENAPDAASRNLLGEVWKTEDQAGLVIQTEFDFKKNLSSTSRQLWVDYKGVIDLSGSHLLQTETFTASVTYDALSRPVRTTSPDDSITHRYYNESQHLDKIYVNTKGEIDPNSDPTTWTPIFTDIQFNARYQTTRVKHGNGVTMTRKYDSYVYRLQQIVTQDASGLKIQDLNYTYDCVGNVTNVADNAQKTVYFRNTRVDPTSDYTYDPTYRVIAASGREHLGLANNKLNVPTAYGASDSTTGQESPGDGTALGQYAEAYEYDPGGNLLSIKHAGSDPKSDGWTRKYFYNEPSLLEHGKTGNRLSYTKVGTVTEQYKYDGSAGRTGNITSMPHLSSMQWNYKNQLQATSSQIVNNGTPETTYYVYDSKGQRVRKVTESQASGNPNDTPVRMKDTIYLQDYEISRRYSAGSEELSIARTTVDIMSENGRIARVESRTVGTDDGPARLIRFQLTNHLGSMSVELDEEARIISYEEYYPFGSTSYQGVASQFKHAAPKRYCYSGHERDEENGLYYHGARYYAPWLGRWISPDPIVDQGQNLYVFVLNNPVRLVDPDGKAPSGDSEWGPPIPITPTGVIGTLIHILVLAEVAKRVKTEYNQNIVPLVEVRTLEGGSTTSGSNEPGEVDLSLLLPDPSGKYVADITDLKPMAKGKSDYGKAQEQVKNYVATYPKQVAGYPISNAVVGSRLSQIDAEQRAKGVPSVLRDVVVETEPAKLTVHLSIAKDRKGNLIPSVLVYQIEIQFRKDAVVDAAAKVLLQKLVVDLLKYELGRYNKKDDKPKGQGEEEKQPEKAPEKLPDKAPEKVPDAVPEEEELPWAARFREGVKVPNIKLTPQQQAQMTTNTLGGTMLIILMVLLSPVGA